MESTDQTLDTKHKNPPEEQQAEGDAVTTKENMGQLVWDRHYQHIFEKLSGSLIAVANKSSSCGLISRATKRRVTDKTVYSQTERASMMIDFIIDNMERKCGNAAEIMETFISTGLDERSLEKAQKYLCKSMVSCHCYDYNNYNHMQNDTFIAAFMYVVMYIYILVHTFLVCR